MITVEGSMTITKKIYSLVLLLGLVAVGLVQAKDDCVACGTGVRGQPMSGNTNEKIVLALAKTSSVSDTLPFSYYQDGYCKKFNQTEINFFDSFIASLEKTQFPIDDYFQKDGCQAEKYGDSIKSPMLHLVADDPFGKEKFPEALYNYFMNKMKSEESWKKAINAKNTKGETTLDYIEYLKRKNSYKRDASKQSVENIIAFMCSKGAVYSKYPETKCP